MRTLCMDLFFGRFRFKENSVFATAAAFHRQLRKTRECGRRFSRTRQGLLACCREVPCFYGHSTKTCRCLWRFGYMLRLSSAPVRACVEGQCLALSANCPRMSAGVRGEKELSAGMGCPRVRETKINKDGLHNC